MSETKFKLYSDESVYRDGADKPINATNLNCMENALRSILGTSTYPNSYLSELSKGRFRYRLDATKGIRSSFKRKVLSPKMVKDTGEWEFEFEDVDNDKDIVTDFDQITDTGVYEISTNAIEMMDNRPFSNAVILEVLHDGNAYLQRATRYGEGGHIAIRVKQKSGADWQNWVYTVVANRSIGLDINDDGQLSDSSVSTLHIARGTDGVADVARELELSEDALNNGKVLVYDSDENAYGTSAITASRLWHVVTHYAGSTTEGGEAISANKLTTPRKITLTGDASGEVHFDGQSDVELSVSVSDDSHKHNITKQLESGSDLNTLLETQAVAVLLKSDNYIVDNRPFDNAFILEILAGQGRYLQRAYHYTSKSSDVTRISAYRTKLGDNPWGNWEFIGTVNEIEAKINAEAADRTAADNEIEAILEDHVQSNNTAFEDRYTKGEADEKFVAKLDTYDLRGGCATQLHMPQSE